MRLLWYSIKNSFARKLTFALTVSGIALVVFVFCAVFMLSNGLTQALVDTGSDDNVIVLRQSASTELVSIVWGDQADIVKADPAIAVDADGAPMFTAEVVVLISRPKRSSGEPSNVTVRGVSDMSLKLRPQIKLAEGRMWQPGTSEIVAGKKLAERFDGCGLGETVRFGMQDWTVVGIMEADGAGFESEIWGDIDLLLDAFERRPVYSSLTMRLKDRADYDSMKERLEGDRRLTVTAMREKEYYRSQSQTFTTFITILGNLISTVFSLGAIVGAMITMYAAVANRTREIGTLRALGFGRISILMAFLVESMIIALSGGVAGIVIANILSLKEVSTTNFDTFAEISFSFQMSPKIAGFAFVFAIAMGLIGGFLPAVRASRLKILDALRAK